MQPIVLYWHPLGPNPAKVLLLLEELRLPYKTHFVPREAFKTPEYEAICLNGRVPAIHDPNTTLTLWESCAILQYLISTYDTTHSLTYPSAPETHQLQQWLYFQSSGQGPYFGQMGWFLTLHSETLPSAQERYLTETRRVLGVLDRHLASRDWLVGDKCTYVDLAFFPWNDLLQMLVVEIGKRNFSMDEFPNVSKWHERMARRPACIRMREVKGEKAIESQGAV